MKYTNDGEEVSVNEIRELIFVTDKNGVVKKIKCDVLGGIIKESLYVKTMGDTMEIYAYRNGLYVNYEKEIHKHIQDVLGGVSSRHNISEVVSWIKNASLTDRGLFNKDKNVINLKNGLLNVNTLELTPHSPVFASTIRIPITHDPDASCPEINTFLSEIVSEDNKDILLEFFGYYLIPDYRMQRIIMLIGEGANGKGVLLNLLMSFIGHENCSDATLHALDDNRFASSSLYGKLVNIQGDLSAENVRNTSMIKQLCGGDTVFAEKKGKDAFSFKNTARLIFGGNKLPRAVFDDSNGWFRRMLVIEFPNIFEGDSDDKNKLKCLTTDEELSGLLNIALMGLNRLRVNQGYSDNKTIEELKESYVLHSTPEIDFVVTHISFQLESFVSREEIKDAFVTHLHEKSVTTKTPINRVYDEIRKRYPMSEKRIRIGKEAVRRFKNIELF
ncbi:MAG: hypothetical protein SYNGOMJ08_00383 [Candidatus Syntrophoarchaeum sp. GoM_oil]|nr:MAG: hypothetical protein SYNGOMJ08_00383 [Candidatus Syntrophoarchaeum sp. GoM_oil]